MTKVTAADWMKENSQELALLIFKGTAILVDLPPASRRVRDAYCIETYAPRI
jgi:hypothetical protein